MEDEPAARAVDAAQDRHHRVEWHGGESNIAGLAAGGTSVFFAARDSPASRSPAPWLARRRAAFI